MDSGAAHQQHEAPYEMTSDVSMVNENGNATTKVLRRACDCCRKRKVKCDGTEPCGPCKKASIRCAYLTPPKKKGPKGLRSARVLHALRRIDDTAQRAHNPVLSPEQHGAFGNWGWESATSSPTAAQTQRPPPPPYGPQSSVPLMNGQYAQPMPPAPHHTPPLHLPQQHPATHQALHRQDSHEPVHPPLPELSTISAGIPRLVTPTAAEPMHHRIQSDRFLPFMRLFFEHMFPIMPVLDRNIYLDPSFYASSSYAFDSEMYCFLCAVCAATVVQMDSSIPQPAPIHPTKSTDDVFAEECLRERKAFDYIESSSTLSVMTSFFLFAYYGNHERHTKAWYYLQESITACENLNLEEERSYAKLELVEAQWRRRLYWLLFITERAYAVQRRKHVRLHACVQLPSVFESEDPQALNGFVNLANLFSAVDESFISAWRGSRRQSLCNEAWLAQVQKSLDTAALAVDNVSETQHLDIAVTREWLHVLAWQMGVSNGLIWGKGEGGMRLDYPIELARKVVEITSGANALALDSHGIGMEQKLSDIAGCLADVLKCTAGDTSATFVEGKQYLNILLQRLASIRGKESRYLQPLMKKMEGLMGYELSNQTLPLPVEPNTGFTPAMGNENFLSASPRWSINSLGMLRTLSMSGTLSMPIHAIPQEDWEQRRPSGRVYDEYDVQALFAQ